jgi:predicted TIM-barrel fold metal-dependent hydrolase
VIVDAHVHVWGRSWPARGRPWTAPHPVHALLEVLDANRVDAAIQVTPSPEGWDNGYGLTAAAAQPERLSVFGRIDPRAPEPERRLRAWIERVGALPQA